MKRFCNKSNIVSIVVFSLLCLYFVLPTIILAQTRDYLLLEPSVIRENGQHRTTLLPYLKKLFTTILMIAVAAPIVTMTYAGLQYVASGIPGVKMHSKTRIRESFIGLAIALFAWMLLYTINPKLIEFNFIVPDQSPTNTSQQGQQPPTINQ